MTRDDDLPLYQIVDYDEHFENNKSRLRERCAFVCVPNKHGGSGLSNVLGEPDGSAIYGIWMLILQLCSRQRKPREGYLTQDGKKNGRRLGARELANLLRRPIEEIHRCLEVCCSPQVGFMGVVDGQVPGTQRTLSGQATSTAHIYNEHSEGTAGASDEHLAGTSGPNRPENGTTPDGHLMDIDRAPDGHSMDARAGTERKKERRNPPTVPQGGTEETGQEQGGEGAPDGHLAGTERTPVAHSMDTEGALQYAEAERWLNSLFPGCAKKFSGEEMHLLSEVLPIDHATVGLLTWAYTLERDKEGWAIYDRARTNKPKHSRLTLLREFDAECQKWRTVRHQLGLNGKYDTTKAAPEQWTAAERATAKEIFGNDVDLPRFKKDAPSSVRSQIEEAAAK
jgi:hypothetical protein